MYFPRPGVGVLVGLSLCISVASTYGGLVLHGATP